MCAPERSDRPTASASSWSVASATCSGVWNRPGVDDLEPRVPQGAGDHLGAAIVAVQAGLGDDDAVASQHSFLPPEPVVDDEARGGDMLGPACRKPGEKVRWCATAVSATPTSS